MTSNRTVLGWLAALALVGAACGGGGGEASVLASADVPIVPEVAEVAPAVEDTPEELVPEEPVAAAPPVVEEEGPAYAYEDDFERAGAMVVLPQDVADVYPTLRVEASHTAPVADFDDYMLGVRSSAFGDASTNRPAAVYEAFLVGDPDESARRRAGSAFPAVHAIESEVAVYGDDARAAIRLAEMRAGYAALTEVVDQPGVTGAGFTAVFDDRVVIGLAGHGSVGKVVAYGTGSADAALPVASVLGVRLWKVSAGLAEPRDPAAMAGGHRGPHQVLDSFAATADVVVTNGTEVLERWRWTGVYEGPDRFSCQQTHYAGGTEELVADVVVAGGTASVFDLATMSSGQYDQYSPAVALAAARCPALADGWRGTIVADPSVLQSEPAVTTAGAGTALRARSGWRLERALGLELADGETLDDFAIFVTDANWVTAIHAESTYPRATAEQFYGGDYGSVERVTVRESVKVTAVDGVEVAEPLYFTGAGEFAVGVGEEVRPPVIEAPAESPAAGGSGGDVQAAGSNGGVGDGPVPQGDDGLFGSGEYINGAGGGHFEGVGPIGGAEDAATQDAVRLTMIGLVGYYLDNGDYQATPADVASYAAGAVTTDDPTQAGSAATVFVPGDQETVVYATSGSGTVFCMAATGEAIIYNSAASASEVNSFGACASGGSTAGW